MKQKLEKKMLENTTMIWKVQLDKKDLQEK